MPNNKIEWSITYSDYEPVEYTAPEILEKSNKHKDINLESYDPIDSK